MKRVVLLGRGGAGKSTFAARLGEAAGLPVIELDKQFWTSDLVPQAPDRWRVVQEELCAAPIWILDGDLGPFDVLEVRLRAADTVVVLDFPLWLCVWRAARRSRENLVFWRWVVTYRRRSLPSILAAVAESAHDVEVLVLRRPKALEPVLIRAAAARDPDRR